MLDLQELAIIDAIPKGFGLQDRVTIAYVAEEFLNDPRFDENVANALIDKMLKNKLLRRERSYIGVTEYGKEEYAKSIRKLRELVFKMT